MVRESFRKVMGNLPRESQGIQFCGQKHRFWDKCTQSLLRFDPKPNSMSGKTVLITGGNTGAAGDAYQLWCLYVAKWCKVCVCVCKDFEEGNDDRTLWRPCFFYVFGVLSKLICKGLGHENRMRLQLSTVRFRCGEHLIQQDPHDINHENQVVHRCCRRLNGHPWIL